MKDKSNTHSHLIPFQEPAAHTVSAFSLEVLINILPLFLNSTFEEEGIFSTFRFFLATLRIKLT